MTKIVRPDGQVQQLNQPTPPHESSSLHVEPARSGDTTSPSETAEQRRARIKEELRKTSMSLPSAKMAVAEIPGFRAYWMNDVEGKIQRALRMGYEFVSDDEVKMHDFSIAGDSTKTGNQDMGTRVSMIVGSNEYGQPVRAYLMKITWERYEIAQELQQEINDRISQTLRRGRIGVEGVDVKDLPIPKTVEISRRDHIVRPAAVFNNNVDI